MNQWLADFTAASIAGILGTVAGHPLDTVKCRLQVYKKEYKSTFYSLAKIIREEKFRGLFKGVIPPVLNQFPINAILFTEYYRAFRYLDKNKKTMSQDAKYFIAGSYSGFINVFINTPCELVKCQQQMCVSEYKKLSTIGREIYASQGLLGLYRGFWVTFNRDCFSYGLYFWVFYKLKDFFKARGTLNDFKLMFAGGLAGVATWGATYPFDTLKTLIQTRLSNQANNSEKTLTQFEAYKFLRAETASNVTCLFNGVTVSLVRAFIWSAVIFYTNELSHKYLDPYFFI